MGMTGMCKRLFRLMKANRARRLPSPPRMRMSLDWKGLEWRWIWLKVQVRMGDLSEEGMGLRVRVRDLLSF